MNTLLKEETLGQRIKAARVRKNMTQEALAEEMRTTKSMISYYENDHGDMKQSMISEFADILGTTVEYLICGVIKAPELDTWILSPKKGLQRSVFQSLPDAQT